MDGPIVEISGLMKAYRVGGGHRQALNGLEMSVGVGEVHGFLGPNGSGKTTTLRALLGLIKPDSGTMRMLGKPVPSQLPLVIKRVGAVVESPRFFPNFSAQDTLSLLVDEFDLPRRRVGRALELVGLRDRSKDRIKTYSLGMKQRLAVASALLKEPDVLILDEPTNGLDPGGIREMCDMMATLAADGTTIILSSHILSVAELICDTVTVISQGRHVAAGPLAQILRAHSPGDVRIVLDQATAQATAATVLGSAGIGVTVHADHLIASSVADLSAIPRLLENHQIHVIELTPVRSGLEDVFLRLTRTVPIQSQSHQVDQSL